MGFDRLFDDDQLDLLATPLSIRLERAAKAQDAEAANGLAEEMDGETLAIYDAYLNWMGVLQGYIVRRGGEEAHDEAMRWVAEYGLRPFLRPYEGLDLRGRALLLAEQLRANGSTFTVEASPGHVRFVCDPWGPQRWWRARSDWEDTEPRRYEGERIVYPNYGGGEDPRGNFPVLQGARALTQGRDSLPCVLVPEIQFLEILPIEMWGRPLAVLGLPEERRRGGHARPPRRPGGRAGGGVRASRPRAPGVRGRRGRPAVNALSRGGRARGDAALGPGAQRGRGR